MTQFEGIQKACLAISYANGGVNRDRSEEDVIKEYEEWIAKCRFPDKLPAIDKWFLSLTDSELELVTDGDFDDAKEIMEVAPPYTERLLNDFFEEVC